MPPTCNSRASRRCHARHTRQRHARGREHRSNIPLLPASRHEQPLMSNPADLASGIRSGDRATLARAITLIESKRADHQKKAHQLVQELLPQTGNAIRVGITGAPGVGKSHHHRHARHASHRQGPQGRGAGGRSVLDPHRRLDPRRQDPDGAARDRSERVRAALAVVRHARRRRRQDARDHAAVRGRRLRRRAGRDRRHRPVGDRGRRHDRLLPRADAAGRGRRTAGHQEGPGRARRHDRGQQGRRRQPRARTDARPASIAPRCTS